VFVSHPAYIREKARQMRAEKDLTIDEIAERLAISRQTIFHWVRDLPMRRPRRRPDYELRARENSLRFKRLRDEAYENGCEEFDDLVREATFRDFVCMYVGEGSKRNRNRVAICNSDPRVMILAHFWMRRFARNPLRYSLQYHDDQDLEALKSFWASMLDIDGGDVRLQRKSNSNHLTGRTWRSRWGVLTISSNDTYFRARLQAWIDRTTEEWLDSAVIGA
jgi:transcriptional regulator with XRE-family HTH domain